MEGGTKILSVDASQLQFSVARYHSAFIPAQTWLCLGKGVICINGTNS